MVLGLEYRALQPRTHLWLALDWHWQQEEKNIFRRNFIIPAARRASWGWTYSACHMECQWPKWNRCLVLTRARGALPLVFRFVKSKRLGSNLSAELRNAWTLKSSFQVWIRGIFHILHDLLHDFSVLVQRVRWFEIHWGYNQAFANIYELQFHLVYELLPNLGVCSNLKAC